MKKYIYCYFKCIVYDKLLKLRQSFRITLYYFVRKYKAVPLYTMTACRKIRCIPLLVLNPLTPNDHYSVRTAPLTSKRCILYIYSRNIGTEYFEHGIYSLFFPLQNAVCFIILTYLVPVLFTFYIQGVLKLKK